MRHNDTLKLLMPVELGPVHDADLAIEGDALDAAVASADLILKEMLPDTALASIPDWERVLGITPAAEDSIATRRGRCVVKFNARGRLDPPYFVEIAAQLGIGIEVQEMSPYMAGWCRSGDNLMPPDGFYVWKITVESVAGAYFRAGSSAAGERLGSRIVEVMKALFAEYQPAEILFFYQS